MDQITFITQVGSRGCGIEAHPKVVATVNDKGIKKTTREFSIFTSSLTELR